MARRSSDGEDFRLIDPYRAPIVLLAAGIGSRFGGLKPLAAVGPAGEPLLVVSLRQAAAAGFEESVVVVSPATEAPIRTALGKGSPLRFTLRTQRTPPGRTKPLGTLDAALAGMDGPTPYAVANGDDLYGVPAMRAAHRWLARGGGAIDGQIRPGAFGPANAAAVLFRVENALPDGTGGVSRAIAEVEPPGRLRGLAERYDIERQPDGSIRGRDGATIAPDALVSLNLWCFRPDAIRQLREVRDARVAQGLPAADELGLPQAVNGLMRAGRLRTDAVQTDSCWLGVTWPGDVSGVRAALERGDA